MACGKPPNPSHMTPPQEVSHPIVHAARQGMREVLSVVRVLSPGPEFDRQLKRAQNWFERVAAAGVGQTLLVELNKRLRHIESEATRSLRAAGTGIPRANGDPTRPETPELPKDWSPRPVAPVICDALTNPNHLLHDKVTTRLMTFVSANQELSRPYQKQLPEDIAQLVKHTPDALGLVKEAVHRGQRHPLASAGKIGTGLGTVYEIMGTASLIHDSSAAANIGGLPLRVDPLDRLDFGIKLQASYQDDDRRLFQHRKTIEADLLIYRPPPQPNILLERGREIAIDFKHAKDGRGYTDKDGREKTKSGTSALATQLAGVVSALKTGEIDEFHFVTNGHFSEGFREAVDDANRTMKAASGQDLDLISMHEHVIAESCKPKLPIVGIGA